MAAKGPFAELMKWVALAAASPFILGEAGVALLAPAAVAITSSAEFLAARDAVLKALASGAVIKKVLGSAVAVMGTATFVNFISEEALQTAGMACFVAKGAQDPIALRAALDNYEALYAEAQKQAALTTWLSPFTKAQFDSNLRAVASAIDSYEAALGKMKKAQAATLAARWEKNKLVSLKATNAVYEKNALDAMNAGELALGGQWLDKIVDAGARLKAQVRVVKAASKTHKAAASEALKRADAVGARNEAALIPDDVKRAAMLDKIATFEAKVAAKLQKARETLARKAVAAQNKATQQAQRELYFASLPVEQQPSWYAAQVAAKGAGAGAAVMAFGSVYYSGATGTYDVATASGMMHTSNATQAAAWAQAAGGKATAAGLAAGR